MIEVHVTGSHIADGISCDPCDCPIGLVILDVTGETWRISGFRAENYNGGRVELPYSYEAFQTRFDRGDTVYPFTFTVEGS